MIEQLKTLFESEVLNEETKKSLEEGINALQEAAYTKARGELEVEFAKKFEDEKEVITEGLSKSIESAVSKEIEELVEDIEKYRKLEVQYAKQLRDFKADYATKLEGLLTEHVNTRVDAEFKELSDQLEEARKVNFGKRIYEAFAKEFADFGVDGSDVSLRKRLSETKSELKRASDEVEALKREMVMEGLLKNLAGKNREVMRTILENCPSEKMEARYNEVIKDVLDESVATPKKKVVTESKDVIATDDGDYAYIRRMAGISK